MVTPIHGTKQNNSINLNTPNSSSLTDTPTALLYLTQINVKSTEEDADQPGSMKEKNISVQSSIKAKSMPITAATSAAASAANLTSTNPIGGPQIEGFADEIAQKKATALLSTASMLALPSASTPPKNSNAASANSSTGTKDNTTALQETSKPIVTKSLDGNSKKMCNIFKERLSKALNLIQNTQFIGYVNYSTDFVTKTLEFSISKSNKVNYEELVIFAGAKLGFNSVFYRELVGSIREMDPTLSIDMFVPPEISANLLRWPFLDYFYTFLAMNLRLRTDLPYDEFKRYLLFLKTECENHLTHYSDIKYSSRQMIEKYTKDFTKDVIGTEVIETEVKKAYRFAANFSHFKIEAPILFPSGLDKNSFKERVYNLFAQYVIRCPTEFDISKLKEVCLIAEGHIKHHDDIYLIYKNHDCWGKEYNTKYRFREKTPFDENYNELLSVAGINAYQKFKDYIDKRRIANKEEEEKHRKIIDAKYEEERKRQQECCTIL